MMSYDVVIEADFDKRTFDENVLECIPFFRFSNIFGIKWPKSEEKLELGGFHEPQSAPSQFKTSWRRPCQRSYQDPGTLDPRSEIVFAHLLGVQIVPSKKRTVI